jgi:hypothetical protein
MAFFFLPSGVISIFVTILMVPFGHASSQAVHPVQACSLFSSWVITTSPLKRSGSTSVALLSGYCSVIDSLLCRTKYLPVSLMPVSSDLMPE